MNRTRAFAFRLVVAAFALAVFNSTIVGVKAQTPAAPAAKPAPPADDEEPLTPQAPPPLPPGMTGSTMNDPRVGLKAGLYDAGEAAMGMEHLAFLKKADAFQLPATQPDDPVVQKTLDTLGVNKAKLSKPMQLVIAQLAFSNSDFAFQGTHLFQGNFYGVNFFDISNPAKISLLTSLVCPGGQGDVSVYKNLLFMSVEMPNGRLDCGTQGFPPMPPPEPGHEKDKRVPAASPDRFRGVRISIFRISRTPSKWRPCRPVAGRTRIHWWSIPTIKTTSTSTSRERRLCGRRRSSRAARTKLRTKTPIHRLFRIDVIKVPVAAPEQAKVVSSPRVFIDARSGVLNGLNNGGSHGKGAEKPTDTNQCHDITVYSAIGLAAGACSGNGLLLDIRDPVHPKRVDAVNDPNYSYWHSASFSNDGTKVVFTDEWGGGLQPRCRATDPNKWGADAIFNLKDDKLSLASYYKMPAAQTETENCVAHNGSLVPIPGRDIEVQAWYQGGISVVDFTDATHPYEIAYFDRGPIDAKTFILGGDWSAYWYNGYIYGSEIARGLDVFRLVPSKFLTQNEIDAANLVQLGELNVQNQQKITWPSQLVVARAYLDQLGRSQGLPTKRIADLNKAIARAQASHLGKKDVAKLHGMAASVETEASNAKNTTDASRLHALAQILQSPAA